MKFNEIKLQDELARAIEKLGYTNMTRIQEEAIPLLLQNKDIIGQAETGTGKTASFAIPILEKLSLNGTVEALIIAPTRELALQIEDDFKNLACYMKVTVTTLIGGVKYEVQERNLAKKPNVVIATPGRAKDLIEKKKLKLANLKFFVLDEADEMLKIGFKEEIDFIISKLPKACQRMLFSATQTDYTLNLANALLHEPIHVNVSSGFSISKNVTQQALLVREGDKLKILTRILDMNKGKLFIIFGRTKKRSDELSLALNELGYIARALHGDLVQSQREQVIKAFKAQTFDILVCTDVAARGLDIEGIDYVINFDLPELVEYYVHRIGRSGRANAKGTSISFVREVEMPYLEKIMEETGSEITFIPQPSKRQVKHALVTRLYTKVKEQALLDNSANQDLAVNLINEFGSEKVVEALLELASEKTHKKLPVLKAEQAVIINKPKRQLTRIEIKKINESKKLKNSKKTKAANTKKNKKEKSYFVSKPKSKNDFVIVARSKASSKKK